MTTKNDTPVLVAALLLTLAILGGGGWWLIKQLGSQRISQPGTPAPTSPGAINAPNAPNGNLSSSNSLASFSAVTNVPQGIFPYGGSTTWAPIRRDIEPRLSQAHPGFQLQYTNPGPGQSPGSTTGIQMLMEGQLTFAQSSRSLKPQELQAAQQLGFGLKEIPVALEGIAIAVHPTLNIPGLTLDQLRSIYTGQTTNWNQVGGPNLPITPYTRSLDSGGTVEFFVSTVLSGQSFGTNARIISTTTEALRALSADVGGIYYASAPEVVNQCTTKPLPIGLKSNQLIPIHQGALVLPAQCPAQRNQINPEVLLNGSYPITRRLTVVVKENGQLDEQAGNAYAEMILSEEGQQLLGDSGFVRIR